MESLGGRWELSSADTVRSLMESAHNLMYPMRKIGKELGCFIEKKQELYEQVSDKSKKKNKEERLRIEIEFCKYMNLVDVYGELWLDIYRLHSLIIGFPCNYMHGSEPRNKVISEFKSSLTYVRESSQEIAPFLPDISKQLDSECEKLENIINQLDLNQSL